jgi:hypothetical protein
VTYALRITFSNSRRPYERTGLSWDVAMDLKEHFLQRVPPAISGSMTPEMTAR